jgi:hypothetical protein
MRGQQFRLKTAAIATTDGPDKRIAVQLPMGAHFVVLDHIHPDAPLEGNHQVRVQWDGQVVCMFLVDIQEKGEPTPQESKGRAV